MSVTGRPRAGPVQHRWRDQECMACGLRRRELWVRDRRGRAVLALLWWHPTVGGIAVRQFAYMVGELPPPGLELERLEDLQPDVPHGSEPACRP